jgi:hypothetical protein
MMRRIAEIIAPAIGQASRIGGVAARLMPGLPDRRLVSSGNPRVGSRPARNANSNQTKAKDAARMAPAFRRHAPRRSGCAAQEGSDKLMTMS